MNEAVARAIPMMKNNNGKAMWAKIILSFDLICALCKKKVKLYLPRVQFAQYRKKNLAPF